MHSWKSVVESVTTYTLENKASFAIWSNPQSKDWEISVDPQALLFNQISDIHSQEGFIIHPYQITLPGILIRSVNHATYRENEGYHIQQGEIHIHNHTHSLNSITSEYLPKCEGMDMDKNIFIQQTQSLIHALENQSVEKVVLSRYETNALSHMPDLSSILHTLRTTQPNAFISLIYHPSVGLWLGATPELLLSENAQGIFYTMSLAGTQAYDPNKDLSETAWKQKEIEEQAYVSRYIIDCFKHIRLREYKEIGPRTIQSGNLLHLKSDFTVDTHAIQRYNLSLELLHLLHPTSAVCGMPRDKAIHIIQELEKYDRKIFTGYIGPKKNNSLSLYVNLRCAEIFANAYRCYAGAGITIDSHAEKEYQETVLKMSLLKQIFSQHTQPTTTRASHI
jgi:isochorismate synthase